MKTIVQISLDLTSIPEALETARMALRVKLPNSRNPTTIRPAPNIADRRYPKAAPRMYGGA